MFVKIPSGRMILASPPFLRDLIIHSVNSDSKSGMNPKTLQYLMGHSDISVTLNVYTHVNFDDAKAEIARLKVM